MTVYNMTALSDEEIRNTWTIDASEKIVRPRRSATELYLYKELKISNRSLVRRIEAMAKQAAELKCSKAIISGDEVISYLMQSEFEKRGVPTSWTSDWVGCD
jgi:hypothetical protein